MKKYLTINYAIFLLLILLGTSSVIIASGAVRYSICKNNVADAVVSSYDDFHAVNIRLTPSAAEEFSELTGKNINQRLEILFKDKVVVEAIIKDKITSGSIQIKVKSKKEANKLSKDILHYTSKQPCGVITN